VKISKSAAMRTIKEDVTKAFATDEQYRPSVGVPKSLKSRPSKCFSCSARKSFPRCVKYK
jgi:hypothetical protein